MNQAIIRWLRNMWVPRDIYELMQSYKVTFSNVHGQRVLYDLIDNVYCKVYEGSDPIMQAKHEGRRSVVDEIIRNVDQAEHPNKYEITVQTEEKM